MLKTLKFDPHLVPLILQGSKTNTWRLFDDKDLTAGDMVDFLDAQSKDRFATAKLTKVDDKTFAELTDHDWSGHEKFDSDQEMYKSYSAMYKTPVTSNTQLKIIWFELI